MNWYINANQSTLDEAFDLIKPMLVNAIKSKKTSAESRIKTKENLKVNDPACERLFAGMKRLHKDMPEDEDLADFRGELLQMIENFYKVPNLEEPNKRKRTK